MKEFELALTTAVKRLLLYADKVLSLPANGDTSRGPCGLVGLSLHDTTVEVTNIERDPPMFYTSLRASVGIANWSWGVQPPPPPLMSSTP